MWLARLMNKRYQSGIYFQKEPFHSLSDKDQSPNDCFAILFLRISNTAPANRISNELSSLWNLYKDLEEGKINHLAGCNVPSGDLSVLIVFGPALFNLVGIEREIPRDFKDKQFLPPIAGAPILEGSGIKYSHFQHENLGTTEHIGIQFISRTQLATYRAVVETWKHLSNIEPSKRVLNFTTYFTGFQRDDGRSWLGFHDQVSNIDTLNERKDAIFIDKINNNLAPKDFWTEGGTYLAFLRTEIDLKIWEKIERKQQEIIIGRDKLTGIPLAGINKKGNPVTRENCHPLSEIQSYDKRFHDHPDYFSKPKLSKMNEIDENASIQSLSQSHIGRVRHISHLRSRNITSRRIFRQGFEFVEPLYNNSDRQLRVGLNLISFQNDPGRLFFILTDPNWLGNTNFGGSDQIHGIENLLSVLAAGVFFVPPNEKSFPGASIFQ
jgi:Dyp-type peroxidase family